MDEKKNSELMIVNRPLPTEPDKVPITPQALNLTIAGLKCVPIAGNALGEIASQVFKVGDYSPEQRLRNLQFDWLVQTLPPVLARIENLIENGVHVEAPDIGAIFESALETSRKTTGKKRQYLQRALENAYSSEMYEKGQTLRFLKMLGELEYGDILLLEIFVDSKQKRLWMHEQNRQGQNDIDPKLFPEMLKQNLSFHCDILVELRLLDGRQKQNGFYYLNPIAKDFVRFVTATEDDTQELTNL